ncbi:MAG: hypothetical protein WAL24_09605 [Nitrososphaeraceae archaeon]
MTKSCEECGKIIESASDLWSYGYYIGHHEKWVCHKCFKALELQAHNTQMLRTIKERIDRESLRND